MKSHGLLRYGLAIPVASAGFLNFEFPSDSSEPVAFDVHVNETFIEETLTKVRLYRPSVDLLDSDVSNRGWIEGPPQEAMTALAKDWAEDYDWYEVEDEINANFSHYGITINGPDTYNHPVPVHFVHERSENPDAIPLLMLHGWPSSHIEWSKVIKPLVTPEEPSDTAFHVVVPDIPGAGFSPSPEYSGMGPSEIGLIFDSLMKQLGYETYGVASTDFGWMIGMWMAHNASDSIIGHFSDFFLMQPNATDLERLENNQTTPEETNFIHSVQSWFAEHSSYSTVHSQAPLAIGQAVADSPVGFAGWMWHLVHAVSDGYAYTSKEIITNALMLWIPGPWGNMRWYREAYAVSRPGRRAPCRTTSQTLTTYFSPVPWIIQRRRCPRA